MRRTILLLAVSLPFGTAWATPWDANLVVDQTVGWSGTSGASCTSGMDVSTPLGVIGAKRDN